MSFIQFTVRGKAVPMQRAGRNYKTGRSYIPAESAEYRQRIQSAYKASIDEGDEPFAQSIPLSMTIVVTLPLQVKKSWTKDKRQQAEDGELEPVSKNTGDVDNYAKAVQDALNGLAYHDDSQIVRLTVRKRYQDLSDDTMEPATYVLITEAETDDDLK